MDIEEALAGLIAALRSGSTFEMILQNDADFKNNICSNEVSTKMIYRWLNNRCSIKNRNLSAAQRRRIENHMQSVCENLMAAYELSNTLGCEMATCVEAASASYHARRRAEDLQADVSAMPSATIKLLTALPFLSLLAGELLGGHPILILLTTVYGWVLLIVGAISYSLGFAWVKSMLRISNHNMASSVIRK